ncbi:MAG: LacI family DNA-binding transcriptional regulator [Propionibacterium sp.]|nr:LacI family DNA-binding transcriptional regulator [Propionibacterium sp.]
MTGSRSTSADVARRAGVSRATVSYVLNGRTDQSIPLSTRNRVLAAARDLDYVPHAASRALRRGTSNLVLLINAGVPWSTNVTDVEDELTALVAASGRSLVVWRRPGAAALQGMLADLEPCVAISMDTLTSEENNLLGRLGVPLVAADLAAPGTGLPTELQIDRLAGQGHHRIAYLTTSDRALQRFAAPRTDAIVAACVRRGLPEPLIAGVPGGLTVDVAAVARQLVGWLDGRDPVTAVSCFNDLHAAACLAAASDLRIEVPTELSVIGLDDDIFAPLTRPALTTVRLGPQHFARHLWSLARHQLGETPAPAAFTPTAHIVERASVTAPPPSPFPKR